MNNHTLVIRAKKHAGTITTLASFFSRRNIDVEKMSCSADNCGAEMLCTVKCSSPASVTNIVPHLNNMHAVIEAYYSE